MKIVKFNESVNISSNPIFQKFTKMTDEFLDMREKIIKYFELVGKNPYNKDYDPDDEYLIDAIEFGEQYIGELDEMMDGIRLTLFDGDYEHVVFYYIYDEELEEFLNYYKEPNSLVQFSQKKYNI